MTRGSSMASRRASRARQGHGTTITEPDEWNLLDPVVLEATISHDDTMRVLDDLVEVRVALECDMTKTSASRTSGTWRFTSTCYATTPTVPPRPWQSTCWAPGPSASASEPGAETTDSLHG